MLGTFFQISTDNKQSASKKIKFLSMCSKKQDTGINNPESCTGQGRHKKYFSITWPLFEVALSIFNVSIFC